MRYHDHVSETRSQSSCDICLVFVDDKKRGLLRVQNIKSNETLIVSKAMKLSVSLLNILIVTFIALENS